MRHRSIPLSVALALILLFPEAQAARAGRGDLLLTVPNPEPTVGAQFGFWITEVRGNIVASAPFGDPGGIADAGSVYVFDKLSGALLLAIPNPDSEPGAQFGTHLASFGGNILVGAPGARVGGFAGAGAIYVIDGDTGGFVLKIENPFPAPGDTFGRWVAAIGNNILVGAPNADRDPDGPGPDFPVVNAGVAYLIDGNDGTLLQIIENPDLLSNPPAASNDRFGVVAALNSDIVVGAPLDDRGAQDAGTVFVFDGKTGLLRLTIPNPYPGFGDQMPVWVPVKFGNDILVDLMFDSDPDGPDGPQPAAFQQGGAYVFDGKTGMLKLIVRNPYPGVSSRDMLSALGVLGHDILIGAMFDSNPFGPDVFPPDKLHRGSAFVFDGKTGGLLQTFLADDADPGDLFGQAVGVVGGDAVVGAPGANPFGINDAGKLYVFQWGED